MVSSDVLEHIHDLHTMIAEISRVLKPGGIFVFDTINRYFTFYIIFFYCILTMYCRNYMSYYMAYLIFQEILAIIPPKTHDWRLFGNVIFVCLEIEGG